VEFMVQMFGSATSFNQDLCLWKDSPAVVNNQDFLMFQGSSGEPRKTDNTFDDQCVVVSYFDR